MGIRLTVLEDAEEKRRIMYACDDVFTLSVVGRDDFEILFNKIDKNAVFIGAYTDDGEIAGYCAFYANDLVKKVSYITLFCVHKKMQRMHVGSRLIGECIQYSKDCGMTSVKLEVLKRDTGAIEFYKYNKFVIAGDASDGSYYMVRAI